jgi:hypothetical protein
MKAIFWTDADPDVPIYRQANDEYAVWSLPVES